MLIITTITVTHLHARKLMDLLKWRKETMNERVTLSDLFCPNTPVLLLQFWMSDIEK